ncbi:MAG: hypothetical protein KAI47_19850 [Deltaproteobacteria bacterium]|nr:hypothetical protein [Deltaproteobacteria bacterium]
MIVECQSVELTAQQKSNLGTGFSPVRARLLQVGNRYPVLGLQYDVASILWGTGAWIQVPIARDRLIFAPLYLFEITDPRPSRHWQVKQWPDGALTLWPLSFYRNYYHGDLEARVQEVIEDFSRVLDEILDEIAGEETKDLASDGRRRSTFEWPASEQETP